MNLCRKNSEGAFENILPDIAMQYIPVAIAMQRISPLSCVTNAIDTVNSMIQ